MGIINRDDVAAFWIGVEGSELVCPDCLRDSDKISNVVTQDELEESEDFYFCDRCPPGRNRIG